MCGNNSAHENPLRHNTDQEKSVINRTTLSTSVRTEMFYFFDGFDSIIQFFLCQVLFSKMLNFFILVKKSNFILHRDVLYATIKA